MLLLLRPDPAADAAAVGEGVRQHLARDLPNFMQPRDIRIVPAFPRTGNGKIDRVALAQEATL